MKAKEIRAKARESMSGRWGKFVGMHLLYFVIQILCIVVSFVPFISSTISLVVKGTSIVATGSQAAVNEFVADALASVAGSIILFYLLLLVVVVITVPLTYSFIKNVIELKRDNSVKATQFFKQWFKYFVRSWKVALWKMWKLLSIYLIFIAVYFISIILTAIFSAIGLEIISVIMGVAIFAGLIALEVMMIKRSFAIALSEYVAIDNEEMTAKDCVNKSMELMNGYKWKLFCLELSFIGWAILSTLTLGIGYLFLTPYMQVAFVYFYENILEENGENLKKEDKVVETETHETITAE